MVILYAVPVSNVAEPNNTPPAPPPPPNDPPPPPPPATTRYSILKGGGVVVNAIVPVPDVNLVYLTPKLVRFTVSYAKPALMFA
jgi:hypothetical protein